MKARTAVPFLFVALTIGLASTNARAGYSEIVAFGDSLSDTGNTYLAAGTPTSPPYYQGHYSNGPIWLEYLANKLGVALPTPSLAGGSDNAWGGAQTDLTGTSFMGTPNIGTQIAGFLAGHTLNGSQLVTVWGGANDFLNAGQTNPTVVVNNLVSEISMLAAAGARNFLVPNLPLLGQLPATQALPQANRDALNQLTMVFNVELKSALNQLQTSLHVSIAQPDISALVASAVANPGAYNFTNVTDAALANNSNGVGYLFWDSVHPTTQADQFIADTSFAAIPEPASLTLMLVAACGLFVPRLIARDSGRN
jgi:phospholipase/lecithinase/hemolysin